MLELWRNMLHSSLLDSTNKQNILKNMKIKTNNPAKCQVHIYLNNLICEKFNVILEIQHKQFTDKNPAYSFFSGKPIRARTSVAAFKTKEDAILHSKDPKIMPIVIAFSECSIKDSFCKRTGLAKALHRLYRGLANK
jgi:hypothetical protein